MRQIFTKVQLVVLWVLGLFICYNLNRFADKHYQIHGYPVSSKIYYDWIQGEILPAIIIAALLIITLLPRKKKTSL